MKELSEYTNQELRDELDRRYKENRQKKAMVNNILLPDTDIEIEYYSTSWQKVNQNPVGVRMHHIPTGIVFMYGKHKLRFHNVRGAKKELARKLVDAGYIKEKKDDT